MRWFPGFLTLLVFSIGGWMKVAAADNAKSVWLVSNGFHTSLAVRARDVPFSKEIAGNGRPDAILMGWGHSDYYRGDRHPWTLCKAIFCPNPSVIHVIPIRGTVANRFQGSDVIRLSLTASQFRVLVRGLDNAFARDALGRRMLVGRGYYAESRFYAGRERFYFPKMCNVWVAQKLRQAGVPIFVPTAIVASELVWQAQKLGRRERSRRAPVDAF